MSAILGITDGDDAGAVLLVDGRLVAAVNEERLNRMKMSIGFPRLAIQEVLELGGLDASQVDRVAMAAYAETRHRASRPNKGWFDEPSTMARIRNEISSVLAQPLGSVPVARNAYRYFKRATMGRRRSAVRSTLAELGVRAPISYHEHHRCHALAAFDASGFDSCLCLTLDGGGDGCSSHVYACDQSGQRLLHRQPSFDSIGNYYAYVTHLCGYRSSIHEGKITGLAARGRPIYKEIFERLIEYREGTIHNVGNLYHRRAIHVISHLLPADWEHEDLAASIQQHLEDVVVEYVRYWLRASGQRRLALCGGVFANVLLNQRLSDLPECDEVFVFPAMGDGGLAAGAAFSELRKTDGYAGPLAAGSPVEHVYLGPAFSEEQIEQSLRSSGLPFERHDRIEDEIARLVHDGRVVARFNGPMEFGPRALGNRSILYRPTDPSVNDWLNRRLQRSEFMPFAPACLAKEESRLFHWNPGSARSARYMTITLDCTEWMQANCQAVVHIDGTARPQVVDRETNPSFHRIIERYQELSGIPVIVNTSFNMHEEPIVASPDDAIRAFRLGKLDYLAIGPFLMENEALCSRSEP